MRARASMTVSLIGSQSVYAMMSLVITALLAHMWTSGMDGHPSTRSHLAYSNML